MRKTKETNWNNLWPIANILNEVCNGIHINDVERKIGFKYENIHSLLRKISNYKAKEEDSENIEIIELDENEIKIINRCFDEVLKQIEEWEFSTRIGISIKEAIEIKNKLTN
jgi:hypothetical protein